MASELLPQLLVAKFIIYARHIKCVMIKIETILYINNNIFNKILLPIYNLSIEL